MKAYFKIGEIGYGRMPWSEVCMHMRIAGLQMGFKILSNRMVQLFDPNTKQDFSAPVTLGEAGFYEDSQGYYRTE